MRSIRLSLTVYFLLLLTGGLGTASILVYRTTQTAIEEKKAVTAGFIEAQFEDHKKKETARLDEALHSQAHTLARLVQFQFWGRARAADLQFLGIIPACTAPQGYLLMST